MINKKLEISKKCGELRAQGYCQILMTLPVGFLQLIETENWQELDKQLAHLFNKGEVFEILNQFTEVNEIEHIISLRTTPDEDGIWHDDGSRKLAFTLSLTYVLDGLTGGVLNFRKRGVAEFKEIPTAPYGTLTIFQTGQAGYEHQLTKVESGKRIISAGWIT